MANRPPPVSWRKKGIKATGELRTAAVAVAAGGEGRARRECSEK